MPTPTAPAQPLGAEVPGSPIRRPDHTTLTGTHATLVPLNPSHTSDLWPLIGGANNAHLWTYMFDEPFLSLSSFTASIVTKSQSTDPMFFAILVPDIRGGNGSSYITDQNENENENKNEDEKSDEKLHNHCVGYISLMRIDAINRVVEIGSIMFSPVLQSTTASTEIIYLLSKYVFETLTYRRFEWKCNNLNAPSKRSAERLGFKYEGTFRKHMVLKGRNRDTAWFSIVDDEWEVVKRGFEGWLREENFDGQGRQIRGLKEVRGDV